MAEALARLPKKATDPPHHLFGRDTKAGDDQGYDVEK